jgi:hypothetical protein
VVSGKLACVKKTKLNPIPNEVYRICEMAQAAVSGVVKGTNLAVYEGLMTMMSGAMLNSRGALIPALAGEGYDQRDSLRIWQGLAHGSWQANAMLAELKARIEQAHDWIALEVGGYRVKALDTVGFFRPRLKGCDTKHYQSVAGKALPAICIGQMGAVGCVGEQRVTVPCTLVRASGEVRSEEDLMQALAKQAAEQLHPQDVVTADRKFSPLTLLKAGCPHVVLRRPKNMTMRRASPPAYTGRGRPPTRGEVVRPLPRRYKSREIPASAPDATCQWEDTRPDGTVFTLEAKLWRNVLLPTQADWTISEHTLMSKTVWTVVVIQHPDFDEPMVVLMNVDLNPQQAYRVVRGRWGIEQPPLVAKQLLGMHRQFVWAANMRFRLPELSLIAAGILTYVAATVHTPTPTGWWDRHPKPTAGRLRRQLAKVDWRQVPRAHGLCKKRSVTRHLPKGFHPALALARALNRPI